MSVSAANTANAANATARPTVAQGTQCAAQPGLSYLLGRTGPSSDPDVFIPKLGRKRTQLKMTPSGEEWADIPTTPASDYARVQDRFPGLEG